MASNPEQAGRHTIGASLIWVALGGLYVNMADTGGACRSKLHRPEPTADPLPGQLGKLVDPVIGLHGAVATWSAWARRPA